jgi:hypothetical protein
VLIECITCGLNSCKWLKNILLHNFKNCVLWQAYIQRTMSIGKIESPTDRYVIAKCIGKRDIASATCVETKHALIRRTRVVIINIGIKAIPTARRDPSKCYTAGLGKLH